MDSRSGVDFSKLARCLEMCNRANYARRYLRNEDFCEKNFLSPLTGKFHTLVDTIRIVLGGIVDLKIDAEYGQRIKELLAKSEFSDLRGTTPQHILVGATLAYFLGNRLQFGFYVEP